MERVSNGSRFRCLLEGPEDASCVVLSHGLATDLTMWDGLVPLLTQTHRVLRYDSRGHGESAATPGDYTLEQLGADVIGLLDACGLEKVHFAGLSMGGMVGMGLALHHPDRLLSLAVCDARGEAPPQYRDAWAERARKVRAEGIEAIVEPSVTRWFTRSFQTDQPSRMDAMRSMIRRTSVDGYAGSAAALRELDYERHLGKLTVPSLFLVGSDDAGAPPDVMRRMQSATPDSRFVEVANAGHLSAVEKPQAFAHALLDFLSDVDGRPPATQGMAPVR
ncbi:3-oxoadipate enol-lactonase [Amorphus coralli]|uniref:3-oxoadipate enol-lactonase n=1 Tax=Amorphus coralli TaxID=340680 RepID=UPI00036DEA43|nr:3-oxoadipate enol-lactonase [Amorphus coralli]